MMSAAKIKILNLGYLDCNYFRIVDSPNKDKMYQSPVSATLIRHPLLGNILYDTGNSPYHRWQYGSHINEVYPVGKFVSIQTALEENGLSCADIDILIISHLHFDHCGGLQYFIDTKAAKSVIVAKKELENACCETYSKKPDSAYVKSLFDLSGITYKLLEEDLVLADDIRLFIQNSHTTGVIGLIVDSENMGRIIFTSDTVYNRDAWENQIPPGGGINKSAKEFHENLSYLKKLQKKHSADLIFGHDSEQILELSKRTSI